METQEQNPIFAIQRIYVKDVSFESPIVPQVFRDPWQPEVSLDLQTQTQMLEDHIHEVTLSLTVTTKQKDKTIFIVEVKQAGIFTLQGFNEEQTGHALGSMCPTILYPYAREVISSLVTHGGFPQLLLAPVNFDALYAQQLEQREAEKKKNQ